MPVHGEATHLRAHADLAEKMGVPSANIFVADNGDTLEMRAGSVSLGQPVESGVIYVDGLHIGDTNQAVLRDRKKLSEDGIVVAAVLLSKKTGAVADVKLTGRGVSFDASEPILSVEACERVRKMLGKHAQGQRDEELLNKLAREAVQNYLWDSQRSRPMVVPFVMEV